MSDRIDRAELMARYSQHRLDSDYMELVAHDIRNEMNTIMMANDMLREELKEGESTLQEYINMISRANEYILVVLEAAVAAQAGRNGIT